MNPYRLQITFAKDLEDVGNLYRFLKVPGNKSKVEPLNRKVTVCPISGEPVCRS